MTAGADLVGRSRAFGQASLVALGAALPFEATQPLARLGPLQLSSVEAVLYLAVAAWALSLAAAWLWGEGDPVAWARRAPAAHLVAAAWGLVLIVSAALAEPPRGQAIKFALRSLGGLAVYAAAADLLRAPAAAARVVKALVAGAAAASALIIAEAWAPIGAAAILFPFHQKTFQVFGLARASGPFQYPNIGAMYLGAVLPLGLLVARGPETPTGAPAPGGGWRFGWRMLASGLALLVMLDGLVLTASRAGLVSGTIALVGLGAVLWRTRARRAVALAAAVALAELALVAVNPSGPMALRLRFWRDADWHRATIQPVAGAADRLPSIAPGAEADLPLEVRNLGALTWPSGGRSLVALGYHWLDTDGRLVTFDGERTTLPIDLPPGAAVTLRARFRAPRRPGRYLLWWDLVQENATWFSERGDAGFRQWVEVGAVGGVRGHASAGAGAITAFAIPTRVETVSRADLWRAAVAAWARRPLFGLGPDNFRHRYGEYLGLRAADERMHANSLYFETLASLGAAGLLALGGVVVALARATRRAAARPQTRPLALGLGAALLAIALHGTLDYGLEFTPTYGLTWLLAGSVVGLARGDGESRS